MSLIDWLLDGLLAVVLLILALRVLSVRGLFHAVVLFICLGLLMALTWVRLAAPDVALAEAGIGAALTGVLLVDVLHKLSWGPQPQRQQAAEPRSAAWLRRGVSGLAALGVAALLLKAVLALPDTGHGLAPQVAAKLEATGASHPVTAVLLDFRSLDTLLELTVLVVAVLAGLSVRRAQHVAGAITAPTQRDGVVDWLPRLLLPLLVSVAGYLLWLGSFTAGGAFQSGIMLAAALVLVWLTGGRTLDLLPVWVWRLLLIGGLAAFLLTGGGLLLLGRPFLDYPEAWADTLVLLLEFAAALTIATALATLFLTLSSPQQGPTRRGPGP